MSINALCVHSDVAGLHRDRDREPDLVRNCRHFLVVGDVEDGVLVAANGELGADGQSRNVQSRLPCFWALDDREKECRVSSDEQR